MPKKQPSRRGRRHLPPGEARERFVRVALNDADFAAWQADAEQLHLSASDVGRIAWRAWRNNSLSTAIIEGTREGD